jgi:transcriptional regulator with PAS, ATPase and Fis domain
MAKENPDSVFMNVERFLLQCALDSSETKTEAAKKLGILRENLYDRMAKHGLYIPKAKREAMNV